MYHHIYVTVGFTVALMQSACGIADGIDAPTTQVQAVSTGAKSTLAPTSWPSSGIVHPKVEIYTSQLAVILYRSRGSTATTLQGVVYDRPFCGEIVVEPNGPPDTACPVFVSGFANACVEANKTISIEIKLANKASSYGSNCALRYTYRYYQKDEYGVLQPYSKEGPNQVNVPYTLNSR